MINISNEEKELIKKLTFLHLKRCNVVSKEKLDLTLSLKFIEAYSPLIKKDYFEKIITFLGQKKHIISLIDKECKNSSLYRQPVIYLLFYLKFNYGKLFNKYWNYTDAELNRIDKDFQKLIS